MFQREDWALFRTIATLGQKAGVPVSQIPAIAAKELVDNALDEAGRCDVGALAGAENGFWVTDPGGGMPGDDAEVAALFSIRRPLTSSKLLRRPSRGALGNGLRVVAGAVLASEGSLIVSTRGRTLRLAPQYATGETAFELLGEYDSPGTRVEVRFGRSLQVSDSTLDWAINAIVMAGGERPYAGKTSPHWYDRDAFFELLQAAGRRTVRQVVAEFDGCAGAKAGKIAAPFKERLATGLDRTEAARLHDLLKASAKVVNPARLGQVGKISGLPEGYFRLRGSFAIGPGGKTRIPVVVEAWAELSDDAEASLFINRTPVTVPIKAWHSKTDLNLTGCGLNHRIPIGRRPAFVMVNVTTPHMPITSDGKAPDLLPLVHKIAEVTERAVKRAKGKTRASGAGGVQAKVDQKDLIRRHLDEAIAKASGDGLYRYSLRQLYYAVRPFVIDALGVEPEYDYFAKVITKYEAEHGDIPGMYRDSRGMLFHPHTGEEIPLGTLNIEAYRRPAWRFNKILYAEKEGFFPILRAANWPERHDCALLTSKGFATRAARDVIDLLGDTDEELWFFAIHDADAYGTTIFQALQEGTMARPGRKVRVVNLGLEPQEGREMGLAVEEVKREGGKRAPVASYVDPEWAEWLQTSRIELNAMTTPQFLAWLDAKFADQVGKVVPPDDVLLDELRRGTRGVLERVITDRAIRDARVEERVEAALADLTPTITSKAATLRGEVTEHLEEVPVDDWSVPVQLTAEVIARG